MYRRRRRTAWTKDRANVSTIWYLVSGSCSVLLTKYTGCCVPSTSWTRATLTVWSVAVIYTSKGWLMSGLWRMGVRLRLFGSVGDGDGGGGGWGCGEPWLTGWKVMRMGRGNGCLLGGGEGVGGGIYSLSSSVGWKAGDFTASEVSLAFPFKLASASILLLRREFSCFSASISSALRFFRSASSCCIFAWPSRIAAKLVLMLGGPEGLASACLFAPALLRVETIFREKLGTKGVRLVPHGGRQLFLQRTNKIG